MSNSLRHNSNRRTSTLFSGLSRTHIDVGFSPGASPPTTVIAKRKDNPLIQQRCSSSSHVLELNNYPDNSNNFYNTQTTTPVSHHRRRTSRTFTPYGRREGVKKDACDNLDEALFGPVPTLASFNYSQANSITPNSTTTITHTQTPPIEQSIFDFEEIIEKQEATILDDDMVFEELEWITNTMNNNNDSLPLSPPLSPFDSESFSFSEPLDDYVLFP